MSVNQEVVPKLALTGPTAFAISLLMQKASAGAITCTPVLTVIQDALSFDEALGQAIKKATRDLPGFRMLDWACIQITCQSSHT